MGRSEIVLKPNTVDRGGVLLVFPGRYKTSNPQVPLSLLHVAAPLRRAGYGVRILDMRVEDAARFRVGKPILVGISSMSGLQIRHGLEFARAVRASDPAIPIVWGGVHPSILPEQTAANEYVDVAVRGEGESTILELTEKLESGNPLDGVAGITYKSEGKIKSNPDRELVDLNSIPVDLPYDLLHLNAYPSLVAGRFHIQTSRGCPHACGFCYNSIFNKRIWRAKSARRVLDEVERVVERFPNVKCIDPIDDNFFVDRARVEDICRGLIERRMNLTWRANCRFDYMSGYEERFIKLLEKSGCVEIDFGAETGSSRLLSMIDKGITPGQMIESAQNLERWAPSIEPYVSWMSGLPQETDQDLTETFDLMDKMRKANRRTQHFGVFIYTPFPCPIMESLGPEFNLPQSLSEWGEINVFHFRPPWHSKRYVDKLHAISAVTRFAFYPEARVRERSFTYKVAYKAINRMAKFRWKHRYFGFPVELKMFNAVARWTRGYV